MFGKMYLECIDTKLLCTDYLPLRSCEFRGLISVVCILSLYCTPYYKIRVRVGFNLIIPYSECYSYASASVY